MHLQVKGPDDEAPAHAHRTLCPRVTDLAHCRRPEWDGRLNQAVSEAQTKHAQDALINRALQFMQNEQNKRMRNDPR